jgi:hypothetical protein
MSVFQWNRPAIPVVIDQCYPSWSGAYRSEATLVFLSGRFFVVT